MESGRLLPHDLASTNDVYIFTNNNPPATVIDANKMIVFIAFFSAKLAVGKSAELYLTDIFIQMALYMTFIPAVFSRGHFRKSLKRFDEMRLVGKLALVSN